MSSPSPLRLRLTQTHGDFWAHVLPLRPFAKAIPVPGRLSPALDAALLAFTASHLPVSFLSGVRLPGMEALRVPDWGDLVPAGAPGAQ